MRITISLTVLFFSVLSGQQFTKITSGSVVADGGDSRSVNWIDVDHDGDLDLFITNGPSAKANNFFYTNNGDGTFTKVTNRSIVNDPGSYDGSTWADYDNDGYLDQFAATWWNQRNSLHRQFNGTFEKVTVGSIVSDSTYSETASWGDYNNDGYVDLYLANSAGDKANHLFKNNGNGTFTKITQGPHVTEKFTSRSVDWFDYDNDHDLDIFVVNEGGENNSLYENVGDGTFSSVTTGPLVNDGGDSFGSSVGDIDNDGDLDVFVANHANQKSFLYTNNGDGSFTKMTSGAPVEANGYSVGSAFGDIDNDGDLDLVVANAFGPSALFLKNFLYTNNGNGSFTKVTSGAVVTDSGWSYGVALGDYDRDGDLDIAFANCYGANQNNALYRNDGNAHHWLTVKVQGSISNRSGIGAKVKVKSMLNGIAVWQYRQVAGQSGYCGQNLESHFGLKDSPVVDSLLVIFPSGQKVVQTGIMPNQVITVVEPVPSGFLRASFITDSLKGRSPFTVNFRDISVANASDPVASWDWDMNGDGISDAITQHAQYTFHHPGVYSASLRISNGVGADTIKASNMIQVLRPVSAPVIQSANPIVTDTSIAKNGKVAFAVSVIDTSDSPVSYLWTKNSAIQGSIINSYAYASNAFLPAPRVDTVVVTVSNEFFSVQRKWFVSVGSGVNIVREVNGQPTNLLHQNYPNPFNPSTTINFELAAESQVTMKLYDSVGREMQTLIHGKLPAGLHSFELNASHLPSGTYYYKITSGSFNSTKKFVLVK